MSTPYIGFDAGSLDGQPSLKAGDTITCPHCGELHEVKAGQGSDGKPADWILFYNCGGRPYIAGLEGKSIIGKKPDVSGEV